MRASVLFPNAKLKPRKPVHNLISSKTDSDIPIPLQFVSESLQHRILKVFSLSRRLNIHYINFLKQAWFLLFKLIFHDLPTSLALT